MALNRAVAVILALFGLAGLGASHAGANFADSAGFSGRSGFTCVACHTQPNPQNDAQATLSGLPQGWDPGKTYTLTVGVTGGPPAMPAPQAQGGFDLASDGGRFAGDPAFTRTPSPQEITYRPDGTHQREWSVTWTAPGLALRPAPVRFWLAVLSANGNHVIATNASDGGETLDAAAALQQVLAPSAQAIAAWESIPLAAPIARANVGPDGWVIDGHQTDANATAIALRLDGGPWTARESGTDWRMTLPDNAPHRLAYRSEGAGRRSADQELALGPSTSAPPSSDASHSAALPPLALAGTAIALILRRPHP